MTKGGFMSFRAHCGETEHHPAGPLGRRLSSWYSGLRPSSTQKSSWAPYVSRHMTKLCRTSSGVKISTASMKEDGNMLSKMHDTARHSNATKSGSCIGESSRWKIWCSGRCSLERVLTSSPRLGGPLLSDPSLPPWMCPPGYGEWRTAA
jgi:hypothetical protein